MKVTFENPDKVNGLMTITVEEADFKENVEKTLKNYRKKANVPGFRPGQVPMGSIKRQVGTKGEGGRDQQARRSGDLQVCTGE